MNLDKKFQNLFLNVAIRAAISSFNHVGKENKTITSMIKNGFTGDKERGGFYKTGPDGRLNTLQLVGHEGEDLPPYAAA